MRLLTRQKRKGEESGDRIVKVEKWIKRKINKYVKRN